MSARRQSPRLQQRPRIELAMAPAPKIAVTAPPAKRSKQGAGNQSTIFKGSMDTTGPSAPHFRIHGDAEQFSGNDVPPRSKAVWLGADEVQNVPAGDTDSVWLRLCRDAVEFPAIVGRAFPRRGVWNLSLRVLLGQVCVRSYECQFDFDAHPLPTNSKIHVDKHTVSGRDEVLVRLQGFHVTCIRIFIPSAAWRKAKKENVTLLASLIVPFGTASSRPENTAPVGLTSPSSFSSRSTIHDAASVRLTANLTRTGDLKSLGDDKALASAKHDADDSDLFDEDAGLANKLLSNANEAPCSSDEGTHRSRQMSSTEAIANQQIDRRPGTVQFAEQVDYFDPELASDNDPYFEDQSLVDTQRNPAEEFSNESESDDDFGPQDLAPSQMFPEAAGELDSSLLPDIELDLVEDTDPDRDDAQLGRGSYARVFRARRSCDNKQIAVKEFEGLECRRNARNEAIILHTLSRDEIKCPNVVAFLGWRKIDKKYQIGLELCERGSLFGLLRQRPKRGKSMEERHAWFELQQNRTALICGIARAMEYVHSKRIIHADLSSMNILVTHDWQARVCDFNLSTTQESMAPTGRGAERWMAPEMLHEDGPLVTSKIDVYSFGVILWELFHLGATPWSNEVDRGAIAQAKRRNSQLEITFDRFDRQQDHLVTAQRHHVACPDCRSYKRQELQHHGNFDRGLTSLKKKWKSLIIECWNALPKERPSFVELVRRSIERCELAPPVVVVEG